MCVTSTSNTCKSARIRTANGVPVVIELRRAQKEMRNGVIGFDKVPITPVRDEEDVICKLPTPTRCWA